VEMRDREKRQDDDRVATKRIFRDDREHPSKPRPMRPSDGACPSNTCRTK
jgi:hypothetical protein